VVVGLLTFGVVFSLLEFSPSAAAPGQPAPTTAPTPTPGLATAADSLEPRIDSGNLAIGVPVGSSEALLRNVQPGDRLDIVATLVAPQSGQPLTAVLVRGATVVRPGSPTDPLLIQASAADALMLAHVVLRGTHLGYILWPANGEPPPAAENVIDENTAREALGLNVPTVTAPVPTQLPTPPPAPLPATPVSRPASGFLYQVQPEDTWDSIAVTFGVPVDEVRQWNESSGDASPVPGSLVFIPRSS
jgi:hypothetical protein